MMHTHETLLQCDEAIGVDEPLATSTHVPQTTGVNEPQVTCHWNEHIHYHLWLMSD